MHAGAAKAKRSDHDAGAVNERNMEQFLNASLVYSARKKLWHLKVINLCGLSNGA